MLLLILMRVLDWAINVYITVLFIRMILDWVAVLAPRWYPRGIVVALINVVYRITDPPLRWLRRFIPAAHGAGRLRPEFHRAVFRPDHAPGHHLKSAPPRT